MKKKIIALLMAAGIVVGVTGCEALTDVKAGYDTEDEDLDSMFVCVEMAETYKVVYDKETKVMYVVSDANYSWGHFELLVNADGTPKLYEGE